MRGMDGYAQCNAMEYVVPHVPHAPHVPHVHADRSGAYLIIASRANTCGGRNGEKKRAAMVSQSALNQTLADYYLRWNNNPRKSGSA